MDYDQATKTAEKLLRMGTLSYKQISYASGIPLWSIREIQTEMNMERRRLLLVLRKTMMEIGEGIHGAAKDAAAAAKAAAEKASQAAQQAANAKYIEQLRLEAGMTDDEDIPFD